MGKAELENINKKYLSGKNSSTKREEASEFRIIEDKEDLSLLGSLAASGTRKGFERAKRASAEILIVQNGKLIRKKPGKPNQVISKLEERKVEVGKTISI